MSGDKEVRHAHARDQRRAARHEVQNSLYAVELTAAAMASTEELEDRESLSRVISEEVARIRVLLTTLADGAAASSTGFPHQTRRGE